LRQVIFLTDGQVGDEDEIFRTVKWKIENDRFFSIGIGSAPNSYLLTKLAELGRGAFTYIGSTQEVGQKMHDLFDKLESPALTDIEVDFPTEVNAELALGTISDLYAGETITAVYKVNVLPDNLIISGNGINGVFSKNITINSSNNTKGLDVLWGRRKIDRLKDIYNNQFKEKSRDLVKQDIVTLALQHHLVSDFTSLVAVDVTPTRPESEQLNSQSIVKKRKAYLSTNYNPQDVALEAELALFEAELSQFIQQSSQQLNSMAMAALPKAHYSRALPANAYAAVKVPAAAIVVPASRTATNSQLFMYVGALILLLAFILRRRKPV
jgi:Ca-activated chloride channel family protein